MRPFRPALATFLFLLSLPAHAAPHIPCASEGLAFARDCASRIARSVSAIGCGDGRATFRIEGETPDAALTVEVRPAFPGAFVTAGAFGVTPVGEFADWAAEPVARRESLTRFAECLAAAKPAILREGEPVIHRNPQAATGNILLRRVLAPWRILLALALLCAAIAPAFRTWTARRRASRVLALAASWLGVAALDAWLLRPAYFHQNGEGPVWVDYAQLYSRCWYGPGFFDVHGALAMFFPAHAESAVFFGNTLLVATIPVSVWILVRSLGGGRALAFAFALVLAFEPVLVRVGRSESYFAPMTSFLFAAAAAIAAGSRGLRLSSGTRDARGVDGVGLGGLAPMSGVPREARRRSRTFALCVVAAGLLIAQTARVHGYSWIPSAFLPLVVLLHRGPWSRRLAVSVATAVGVGLVVLVAAGPAMWALLHDPFGVEWSGKTAVVIGWRLRQLVMSRPPAWQIVGLALALAALTKRATRTAGIAALVAGLAGLTGFVTKMQLAVVQPWTDHAWASLYFPLMTACACAILMRLAPRRWRPAHVAIAVAVGAAGLAYDARHFRALTSLSTDQRESQIVAEWTESFEPERELYVLSYIGQYAQVLHAHTTRFALRGLRTESAEELRAELVKARPGDYYLHASLCSSAIGRPVCDGAERGLHLAEIARAEIPAVPSAQHLAYDRASVPVILYRVTAPEGGAP